MSDGPPGSSKVIKFHGSSLNDLRNLPEDARKDIGFQLDLVQRGVEPDDWKAVNTVGQGTMELRVWTDDGTYRTIYVAKFRDAVHVLHVFKKTSEAIPKADINIAKKRYKDIG